MLPRLSKREREVIRAWVTTETKSAAAKTLFLAEGTLSTHLARVRQKYEIAGRPARTKSALLARALQDGIVELEEL